MAVAQPAGVQFTTITTGFGDSAALDSDGQAYTWGLNTIGQLGNAIDDGVLSTVPTTVARPEAITRFVDVSTHGDHGIAVADTGGIYAWGSNFSAQLDNPTVATFTATPMRVDFRSAVAEVTFDGTHGTNLVDNTDGTWSVDTPAHDLGSVPVVVSWELNGVAQDPVTYIDGFTYVTAPTVTDPIDVTVNQGESGRFTVQTDGYPTPTVVWEYSPDNGVTWLPVGGTGGMVLADDALTAIVVGDLSRDGLLFRATVTNIAGNTTSATSRLTVVPTTIGSDNNDDGLIDSEVLGQSSTPDGPSIRRQLAQTGSSAGLPMIISGALVLLGMGAITARRFLTTRS